MRERIPIPDWAIYLRQIGKRLAELPTRDFGEQTSRIVLSLPTGRFTYWMLAAGALSAEPHLDSDFEDGEVVTTWHKDPSYMVTDLELRDEGDSWRLAHQDLRLKTSLIAVRTPADAPDTRRSTRMSQAIRDSFRSLENETAHNRRGPWYATYTAQCLCPIVIIGRGREYIQEQRRALLQAAPDWFSDDSLSLLTRETPGVFDGDQMLFHPYMVLDESVGANRPWIRPLAPRLTVVTSWNTNSALAASLFSRRPRVITANRRVKGSMALLSAPGHLRKDTTLQRLVDADRPAGIEAFAFTEPAQSPTLAEIGDLDEFEDDE